MEFCKQFNARTGQKELEGLIVPVVITVVQRPHVHVYHQDAASVGLLKRAAGIAKGSGTPNKDKVGKVTLKQVEDIAKQKMPDLKRGVGGCGDQERARHGAIDGMTWLDKFCVEAGFAPLDGRVARPHSSGCSRKHHGSSERRSGGGRLREK